MIEDKPGTDFNQACRDKEIWTWVNTIGTSEISFQHFQYHLESFSKMLRHLSGLGLRLTALVLVCNPQYRVDVNRGQRYGMACQ